MRFRLPIALLAAACGILLPIATASAAPLKRITSASSVRLRATPSTSAAVVDTLGIGVVLDELERSGAPQKINGVEEYWYRVSTPNGKQGWVFGGLARAVDANRLDDAALEIGRERLDSTIEELKFADWADLAGFLGRAAAAATSRDAAAELELMRLAAASNALASTPYDAADTAPYTAFRAALGDAVVYNEIGGNWLVTAESYWKLRDRYASLPIAERIAWDAANVQLPGECEGDASCHLSAWLMTMGRYLGLYPAGTHADEAIGELVEVLRPVVVPDPAAVEDMYTIPSEAAYRADMRKDAASARTTVAAATSSRRDEALRMLDTLDARLK
jgi:hypothetical protein